MCIHIYIYTFMYTYYIIVYINYVTTLIAIMVIVLRQVNMILFPSGVKVVSGLDLCSYRCGCAGAYLQHAAYHRILHRHISFVMNLFPADLIFLFLTPNLSFRLLHPKA